MSIPAGTETPTATPSVDELEDQFDKSLFRVLTLNDRCDRDSAEAAVAQVQLPDGSELLFCGHHWREYEAKLSIYPHNVPDAESKPMTWGRAAELGPVAQRDGGTVGA